MGTCAVLFCLKIYIEMGGPLHPLTYALVPRLIARYRRKAKSRQQAGKQAFSPSAGNLCLSEGGESQELKRRSRVARVFPNEKSLFRPISALLSETSDDWETGRIYLNMENQNPPSV
jgi:hypothetical protein